MDYEACMSQQELDEHLWAAFGDKITPIIDDMVEKLCERQAYYPNGCPILNEEKNA